MKPIIKKSIVGLAMVAISGSASAVGELNLYNWGNYTSPELIEKFTAETGITVTITDYDSNTTALAMRNARGADAGVTRAFLLVQLSGCKCLPFLRYKQF